MFMRVPRVPGPPWSGHFPVTGFCYGINQGFLRAGFSGLVAQRISSIGPTRPHPSLAAAGAAMSTNGDFPRESAIGDTGGEADTSSPYALTDLWPGFTGYPVARFIAECPTALGWLG